MGQLYNFIKWKKCTSKKRESDVVGHTLTVGPERVSQFKARLGYRASSTTDWTKEKDSKQRKGEHRTGKKKKNKQGKNTNS